MVCNLATYEQDKEHYIKRAGHLFEGGLTNYKAFGERMVKEFGKDITKHVEDIWQEVQDIYAAAIRKERYTDEAHEAIEKVLSILALRNIRKLLVPLDLNLEF